MNNYIVSVAPPGSVSVMVTITLTYLSYIFISIMTEKEISSLVLFQVDATILATSFWLMR